MVTERMLRATARARASCRGVRLLEGPRARPGPPTRVITFPPPSAAAAASASASASSAYFLPSRHLPIRSFTSPPDGPSSSVIAVKSDAEYLSALNLAQENNGLAVIYFTAKWCGPCRMVSPVVDELSLKHDKATFLKVDIDEEKLREVVSDEKITSVPTFRFFRGGKSIGEIIGANVSALKEKVAALLGK